jgi:hypothetical protein
LVLFPVLLRQERESVQSPSSGVKIKKYVDPHSSSHYTSSRRGDCSCFYLSRLYTVAHTLYEVHVEVYKMSKKKKKTHRMRMGNVIKIHTFLKSKSLFEIFFSAESVLNGAGS